MTHNRLRSIDQNVMHDMALVEHFRAAIGMRTFILTPSYPFMFVGEIVSMVGDQVEIFAETTHFAQLEKRNWLIHVHNIEVFYIEFPGDPRIPELNDML
ncbi:hypothetical protein L2D08_14505 [Domibacillus sp. PGB-M46]|uniref:hypothetical protein n=1 Tax=Domibacillus sp. PGB-M46 TaxID=2910255 RepID=UPI001F568AFF|nr:hypothetical protein [Domibacillus sp. PGB-M46]MCI2255581.1 hypothetical protein [Domibacillus sp. PGB-M46]